MNMELLIHILHIKKTEYIPGSSHKYMKKIKNKSQYKIYK